MRASPPGSASRCAGSRPRRSHRKSCSKRAAGSALHRNEERFRRAYAKLARGRLEAAADLLDDDVVCHVPGRSRLAGDLRGRDDVLALLARLVSASKRTYTIRAEDVLANDRHVVVLEEHVCELDGERYEGRGVTVARVEDGRAIEVWIHADDPYGADEFRELVAERSP